MQKIQIASLRGSKEALLRVLQEEEVIHITETDTITASSEEPSSTAYYLAKLQFVIEFMDRIRHEQGLKVKRSWRDLFSHKPSATVNDLEDALKRLHVDTLLSEAQRISDELNDLQTKEENLETEIATLSPWQSLQVSWGELSSMYELSIHHALIVVTDRTQPLLEEKLNSLKTADWQVVSRVIKNKRTYIHIEVVTHAQEAEVLEQYIKEVGATIVSFQIEESSTLTDKLKAKQAELEGVRQRYQANMKEASSILRREQDIKFAYDALLHRQERELVHNQMTHLPHSVVMTGWVPANKIDALKQTLATQNITAHLELIPPVPGEKIPVSLRNNHVFNAFEAVTNIYGKPAYHELDPSPVLSIFFLAAFGLALTDAGYGIVLILSMWAALKFFRLKKEMRKMVKLLLYAGISTTILGALAGGWFSINLEQLPPGSVRTALLAMKVIDPLVSPMALLGVSLGLGIIQLLFAWGVRGYDHWRTGNRLAVFLDDIPWITMVVGLLAWVAAGRNIIIPAMFAESLKIFVIINAGVLVFTQGRASKNPILKVANGALSLYGLINFLSDTLSYSRLLALGLATGIIGLVVNMVAGIANETAPIIGPIAAVAILLAGHLFNLGINTLGAFIHSGRLQFVEFFPKFLEGGGLAYKPFGRVSRYVTNPNEFE